MILLEFLTWQSRYGNNDASARKHNIESSLIGTTAILRTSHQSKDVEKVIGVDDALVDIDFKRNLKLIVS